MSVLGNLVDNAMDAAAESEDRWVQVVLRRQGDAGVVLEVSDSGPGVAPALRERIFEQGYSTKPADAQGRGIGLALVRSVVTGAGGSVTMSDAPTTFRISLPAAGSRRSQP